MVLINLKREGSCEKKQSKKNFIYQLIYQMIMLMLPIVTAPYLTRILGDVNLGVYTYTFSIANYFVIFAMLGISRYGQRIISSRRNDQVNLRKTFWSLYCMHILLSIIAIIFYLTFCAYQTEYKNIFFIQIFYVLSALFDITWLFYGLENFKSVVVKNLVVKIIETSLIFILIKSNQNILEYTIIMSTSLCVGQLVMLPQAIKKIKPIRFNLSDFFQHLKPMIIFSVTVIAASLYTIFDKTLLGILSTKENVAYYEYSNKIITIPKTIITVIGTIMFPRACLNFEEGKITELKKYFKYSLIFAYLIGFGAMFGLFGISNLFAFIYYGENFAVCGEIIKSLLPAILIISLGDIVRSQILIPMHKDFSFAISLICSAIINIILTIIFIPKFGVYGAVLGTITAELFGLTFQLIICRKYIDFGNMFISMIPFLMAGSIMLLEIEGLKTLLNKSILDLLIQIVSGLFVYLLCLFIYFFLISKNRFENANFFKTSLKLKKEELGNDNANLFKSDAE